MIGPKEAFRARKEAQRGADHRQAARDREAHRARHAGADGGEKGRRHRSDLYRWRLRYGALKEEEAKRLQLLEQENSRLKRIVADQALDISILKEVAKGKF